MSEITQAEKNRLKKEQERIDRARAQEKKDLESDDIIRVEFRNEEDPPAEGRPSPTFKFAWGGEFWELDHGEVYELPKALVMHLNGLKIPYTKNEKDPITGQTRVVKAGDKNRCSCVPTFDDPKPRRNKPGPKPKTAEQNAA